jgi:hypothetical protein
LEPQIFMPIEENEHDAPETTLEEHVVSSQPSQGKNILNLPYSDSEDSEPDKDEHNKEVPVQEPVTTTHPKTKGTRR